MTMGNNHNMKFHFQGRKQKQEGIKKQAPQQQNITTASTATAITPHRPHHQEQEISRSVSWESWSSSLTSLSDELHDDKRTWSFKDDYVSFPSLIDDNHGDITDIDNSVVVNERQQQHHHHHLS
ncbi:hypothetical protein BDC45DRAFT_538220 [Circinella umbellata]|nr:hypothetical protein BDC45DRAFT_538220 [Circinella umbellata]